MVQWLGLCTFTAEGVGSIPVWGAKILASCVVQPKKEKKKKEISTFIYFFLMTSFLFYFILCLNLKHCISFAKHQNKSATGIAPQVIIMSKKN